MWLESYTDDARYGVVSVAMSSIKTVLEEWIVLAFTTISRRRTVWIYLRVYTIMIMSSLQSIPAGVC